MSSLNIEDNIDDTEEIILTRPISDIDESNTMYILNSYITFEEDSMCVEEICFYEGKFYYAVCESKMKMSGSK
jgi:hypothetical protein